MPHIQHHELLSFGFEQPNHEHMMSNRNINIDLQKDMKHLDSCATEKRQTHYQNTPKMIYISS